MRLGRVVSTAGISSTYCSRFVVCTVFDICPEALFWGKDQPQRSYEQLLRLHVMPRFGSKLLTDIRRDEVKRFVAELCQAMREVNCASVLNFSRNALRLIISALRAVLNAALGDSLVDRNPASKVGKFAKTEQPARQASAMTRKETEEFLAAVREVRPRWYPFFLTADQRSSQLYAMKRQGW